MKEIGKDLIRKRMGNILEALKKRGFESYFFETKDQAKNFISDIIKAQETVGVGGSMTLRDETGIVEMLRKRGNYVCDHLEASGDPSKRLELKRQQRSMDVFLSSVNALTSEGILINLDGGGNRVAGMCCGPKRVIIVAGTNKITDSLDLGIRRTRHQAAVLNALRLKRKTPCVETGVCNDCDSPERICAALLILFKKPSDIDQYVVIFINEEMGF